MTSYAGRHAELYDLFYADKPYAAEAAFIDRCVRQEGNGPHRRLLELACGTGRHACEFERLGYQVVGVDHSASMLARAKCRARELGTSARFLEQDLAKLDAPGGPFDVATCLFDSLGYLQTNAALLQAMTAVHRHLRESGLFICEFWHAAAMLRSHERTRVRRWPFEGGQIVRLSETVLDVPRQLGKVHYTVLELRSDGRYSHFEETQQNRFFQVGEMAALLEAAGFAPLRFFAGFDLEEPISADTWHVVAVARRGRGA